MSTSNVWDTPILHADLDAFYASVEVLRDPRRAGRPVIVGGTSSRGVVTSASYEARRFGVSSAMPTSRARRLCPDGIFIQPDFEAYADYSRRVREIFSAFSPVVEPLSLDEAFIDVRGARRLWGSPIAVAEAVRWAVREGTGLTASVGVASNKFLAKVASGDAKPDGVVWVDPGDVSGFLDPFPIERLWGVGEQTASVLRRLGLKTIGDVARIPVATLERALGSLGLHIARLAAGRDERRVIPGASRRSIGAEETFERDLVVDGEIHRELLRLADRVASRLRAGGTSAQTVTLKVRFSNFTTITRSRTLPHEIDGASGIYQVARGLWRGVRSSGSEGPNEAFPTGLAGLPAGIPAGKRVRLLGVSASKICDWPASMQLSFEPLPSWARADRAVDGIRSRFGQNSLSYGTLLENAGNNSHII